MLKILIVILSLGLSQAQASQIISAQVLDAAYTSLEGGIVAVKILSKGGCGETSHKLKFRGCSDFFTPKSCYYDIQIISEKVCSTDAVSIIPFDINSLDGLTDLKLKKTNLVINGSDSKKSQVKVRKNLD